MRKKHLFWIISYLFLLLVYPTLSVGAVATSTEQATVGFYQSNQPTIREKNKKALGDDGKGIRVSNTFPKTGSSRSLPLSLLGGWLSFAILFIYHKRRKENEKTSRYNRII